MGCWESAMLSAVGVSLPRRFIGFVRNDEDWASPVNPS